jgi:hypothetical protein
MPRVGPGSHGELRVRHDLLPFEIRQRDLCLAEPDPQPGDDDEAEGQRGFADPPDLFGVRPEDPVDQQLDSLRCGDPADHQTEKLDAAMSSHRSRLPLDLTGLAGVTGRRE